MTSTARALLLVPVVTSVLGVAAASFIGEADEAKVRPAEVAERVLAARPGATAVATAVSTAGPTPSAPSPVAIASPDAPVILRAPPSRDVLEGLVMDVDGAPIAGATIQVTDADGLIVASTLSRVDGTFSVDDTDAPAYVYASAPDHVQSGLTLDRALGAPTGRLAPIVLQPAVIIRGLVTSPRGPVADAHVRVAKQDDRCCGSVKQLSTDANGRFELTGCEAGRYSVSASLPGSPRRYSPTRVLTLDAGATADVSLELLEVHADFTATVRAPGYPVEGTWSPKTLVFVGDDPLIDHGDPRVTRVPLEVPFEVVVRHGLLIGRARVLPGQRTAEVPLEPVVQLQGQVRWPSGAPAIDARVRFEVAGEPSRVEFTRTDADGAFSFDAPREVGGQLTVHDRVVELPAIRDVAAGETWVCLTLPPTGHLRVAVTGRTKTTEIHATSGGRRVHLRHDVAERLAAGRTRVVARDLDRIAVAWVDVGTDTTRDVRLTLAPAGHVRGRVVDPRGRPVRVELALADEGTSTDAAGRFWFDLVPLGQHALSPASDLDLIAARFHATRATLRDRVVDVTSAEELDLGDLVVEVE